VVTPYLRGLDTMHILGHPSWYLRHKMAECVTRCTVKSQGSNGSSKAIQPWVISLGSEEARGRRGTMDKEQKETPKCVAWGDYVNTG